MDHGHPVSAPQDGGRLPRSFLKRLLFRAARPGLMPVHEHLARLEERVEAVAAKMGVEAEDRLKYESELAYWRYLIKEGGDIKAHGAPFEQIFGKWQRDRLLKLGVFLGLPPVGEPGDIDDWCAERSVIEIGAGPFPAVAAARKGWRRCVAVDPIAKGYVEEGLVPAAAEHVVYIAAPGEKIPLPGGFADLLVIENCLDHVTDPEAVVTEIERLLKPGGLLWLFVDLSEHCDHMHPHPMNERRIRGLLSRFEVVREQVSDHKAHPEAYGGYRVLCRKPACRRTTDPTAQELRPAHGPLAAGSVEPKPEPALNGSVPGRPLV